MNIMISTKSFVGQYWAKLLIMSNKYMQVFIYVPQKGGVYPEFCDLFRVWDKTLNFF
jgi:hypothetical protein